MPLLSSQPTYRSIETFLRGTRRALLLLLQLCLSFIQVHISVKRLCLRTSWRCSSAICNTLIKMLLSNAPRACHTRHQMAHSCRYNHSWKAALKNWLASKVSLVYTALGNFEYTQEKSFTSSYKLLGLCFPQFASCLSEAFMDTPRQREQLKTEN